MVITEVLSQNFANSENDLSGSILFFWLIWYKFAQITVLRENPLSLTNVFGISLKWGLAIL
jgi:hypothetical protein